MKVYTVEENKIVTGAKTTMIAGLQSNYPAIVVGETGRGRKLGLIPVVGARMAPCPNIGTEGYFRLGHDGKERCATCASLRCPDGKHPDTGVYAPDWVTNARLDKSKSGRWILRVSPEDQDDRAVVVLLTPIGFRGSNSHEDINGGKFPLEVLIEGEIAQGDAGRMGGGMQYIALVKPGQSWKVFIGGRRYGKPSQFYYHYTGSEILCSDKIEAFIDEGIFPPIDDRNTNSKEEAGA